MDYLKIRCEEILNDLGYSYTDEDIVNIAKIFNEEYQYQKSFFEEYQVWWNVIDKYYAELWWKVTFVTLIFLVAWGKIVL